MNKPYQSIALELYTKLPYKLEANILIKIMKEVKKKELVYWEYNKLTNMYYSFNIFSKINKRSYNMYLLKKIFNRMDTFYRIRTYDKISNKERAIKTRDPGYISGKLIKIFEDRELKYK